MTAKPRQRLVIYVRGLNPLSIFFSYAMFRELYLLPSSDEDLSLE
jgi:hypothetical protein